MKNTFAKRVASRLLWEVSKFSKKNRLSREKAVPTEPVFVFFAPEADIPPHFGALAFTARTLKDQGVPVVFTRCLDAFTRCSVKDMNHLPTGTGRHAHEQLCCRCLERSFQELDAFGLGGIDLRTFKTPEIEKRLKEALKNPPADLREFVYDGVAFGRLAAMMLALHRKVSDFGSIGAADRSYWLEQIRTSIQAYLIAGAMLDEMNVRAFVYYNDYPISLGVYMQAKKRGIPTYSLTHPGHNNVDRGYLKIAPGLWALYEYDNLLQKWNQWKDLPLSKNQVQVVAGDLFVKMNAGGSHVYSPTVTGQGQKLPEKLGLHPSKKILVVFTSSLDERIALSEVYQGLGSSLYERKRAFQDQLTWLTYLSDLVQDRDDLELVVRIHPREGKDQRIGRRSQHLEQLRNLFANQNPKIKVIWPEDNISSYELGSHADIALISRSSIGMELARMAVPVLAYEEGYKTSVTNGLIRLATELDDYKKQLKDLLQYQVSLQDLIGVFRAYYFYALSSSIDVRDVVPPDAYHFPVYQTPAKAHQIAELFSGGRSIFQMNLAEQNLQICPKSEKEERNAVLRQASSFIDFFMRKYFEPGTDWADCKLVSRLRTIVLANPTEEELPQNTEVEDFERGFEVPF